jgi:hypothetical protein
MVAFLWNNRKKLVLEKRKVAAPEVIKRLILSSWLRRDQSDHKKAKVSKPGTLNSIPFSLFYFLFGKNELCMAYFEVI